jgi:hypothetical protein
MTLEKKYLIELSDILGVEIRCDGCKAKIIFERQTSKEMFSHCPLCDALWLEDMTEENRNIREFVKLLRTSGDILRGRKFSLKVQIAPPPDGESE